MTHPDTETWLESHGLTYTYDPALPLEVIDTRASAALQVRDHTTDPELVDRYAADMAAGDTFPPIVVNRRPRATKVTVIGGNQRTAAARKNNQTTIAAYVVSVEPEMAWRLAIDHNRRHGTPPTNAEKCGHARRLIALTGMTQREAARAAGVTEAMLSQAIAIEEAATRARNLGVAGFDALTTQARYQLAQVAADAPFQAAAQAAIDHRLSGPKVAELRKTIAGCRSEKAALEAIGDVIAEAETARQRTGGATTTGRGGPNARVAALRACTAVVSLDPEAVRLACADQRQRAELVDRLKTAGKTIVALGQALDGRGRR